LNKLISLKTLLKLAISVMCLIVGLYFLRDHILLAAIVGSSLYVLVVLKTGLISHEDFRIFISKMLFKKKSLVNYGSEEV